MFSLTGLIAILGRIALNSDVDFELKGDDIDLALTKGSGVKLLSDFMVEPVIIITEDLKSATRKDLDKVIKYNVNLFTAYYLQILHITMSVHGLDPRISFKLAGSGGATAGGVYDLVTKAGGDSELLCSDEYLNKLASEMTDDMLDGVMKLGVESVGSTVRQVSREPDWDRGYNQNLTVTIYIDEKDVEVPVFINPKIMFVNTDDIMNMADEDDASFREVMLDWSAGLKSTVDVMIGSSLIEAYKEKKLRNPNDLTAMLKDRKQKAYSKITDGTVGFNLYYSMLIMNQDKQSLIESKFHGKLSKNRVKDAFLEYTASILLTLVDFDYEEIEVFMKDVDGSDNVSFKALSKEKKNDTDELIKLLVANKAIF